MSDMRIGKGVGRGRRFDILVDGQRVAAYEGETIAAALLAAGRRTMRHTVKKGQPRGVYCGIGICHECLMVVNGAPNIRTCQTLATPGCRVETQEGLDKAERKS